MRRRRPKTPAPKNGWLIRELSELSGVTIRTLRSYITQGFLRPLQRRGTQTRYPRGELLRVLALVRLRRETKLSLAQIKRKFESWGEAEIERWVISGPLPVATAQALGTTPQVHASPQGVSDNSGSPNAQTETWYHMELLPGLVLKMNSKASTAVRKAAQRIFDEHTARG